MDFISTIAKMENSNVWNMHLTIPQEVSDHFLSTTGSRVLCNIDDRYEFHAALMPAGNGVYFININKEVRKKLRLALGDTIPVKLEPDTSKYGIHLPEEMEELLLQDKRGSEVFHQLTMGKQRSLLHVIGKPKSSDIRLRKALMILDYLKSVDGQLDFKELNVFLKEQRDNYI